MVTPLASSKAVSYPPLPQFPRSAIQVLARIAGRTRSPWIGGGACGVQIWVYVEGSLSSTREYQTVVGLECLRHTYLEFLVELWVEVVRCVIEFVIAYVKLRWIDSHDGSWNEEVSSAYAELGAFPRTNLLVEPSTLKPLVVELVPKGMVRDRIFSNKRKRLNTDWPSRNCCQFGAGKHCERMQPYAVLYFAELVKQEITIIVRKGYEAAML
jgi:hypothetical protein